MSEFAIPTNLNDRRTVFAAAHGDDTGLMVHFYTKPFLMEYLSEEAGRAIYHERIYTKIHTPGNPKTVWDHLTKGIRYDDEGNWEVDENDPNCEPVRSDTFRTAWAKFANKKHKASDGMPIEMWPPVTPSMAETLKAMNIHTVEALSKVTDANISNIMGGAKFRDLAIAYLDKDKSQAMLSKAQADNARLQERIEALEKAQKQDRKSA